MPVIATESTRFSAVVKNEFEPASGYCREVVTINDAVAGVYKVGTVLGKITASGKYKISLSASADGSQVPSVVLLGDYLGQSTDVTVPANTDIKAWVLFRGPAIVADAALTLGTGITASVAKAGLLAAVPPILVEVAL